MSNNKVLEILTALEYGLTENYRAEAVEKAIKCVKLMPSLIEALEDLGDRYEYEHGGNSNISDSRKLLKKAKELIE